MKPSERLRDGMKKQVVGLWIDNSFIDEVEATENELEICKAALDNAKIRLSESVKNEQSLKEQNEKLLRKFKRIPTTISDAYNENVSLREDLILALETCQVLQAGISWFNVDEQNKIMEKLYKKYLVGWDKEDVKKGETQTKEV